MVLDTSAGTHTRGTHVFLVKNSTDHTGVQIGDVIVVFAESVVSFYLVRFFVTGHATDHGDKYRMDVQGCQLLFGSLGPR